MVAVYFHLAWKVKYKVLSACFCMHFLDLSNEPVNISLEELHAIYHAAIRSELILFHNLVQANQLLYVDGTL